MAEIGTVSVGVKGDYDGFEKDTESRMGAIAKKAAAAFAAAFVIKEGIEFGKEAIDQASDLAESINAVDQTFGQASQGIHQLGEQAATSVGLTRAEFSSLAVAFAGFAEQIDPGDVVGVIDDMTTRVADFASVMNLDVNTASTEFRSIMAGSSEVARKYGLDVGAAAVEQFALESGLAASKEELTESIKVQARYGLLMQATDKWAGDFANTSDQLANSTRIAQAQFKEAQAELGDALLPVMEDVVNMTRASLIPLLSQLAPVFAQVGGSVGIVLPVVVGLIEKLAPLVAKILPLLVEVSGQVVSAILALADPMIVLLEAAITPLLDILGPLIDQLAGALAPALEVAAELVLALVPVIDLLIPFIELAGILLGVAADVLGKGLATGLRILTDLLNIAIGAIRPFVEWIGGLADLLSGALSGALGGVIDWFTNLPTVIYEAVRGAATWLVDTGKDLITGFIDGIKSMAGRIVQAIKDWVINKIPGPIKSFFGISSPSKLMAQYGADISRGMALGIRQEAGAVARAVDSLLVPPPRVGVSAFSGTNGDLGLAGVGPLSLTFNGPVGGDMGVFAQQIAAAQARESRFRLG